MSVYIIYNIINLDVCRNSSTNLLVSSALVILSLVLCLLVMTMSAFLLLLFELVTTWYGLFLGAHLQPNILILLSIFYTM